MSEALNLAQNFKTKSQQQAKIIEQEVENATKQLNDFMTEKLRESETIIKQGMDNLDTSNDKLIEMLKTHHSDMNTALKDYLSNVQVHLTQDLEDLASQTEKMIEDYTQHIAQLIREREDRIAQVIKSEMKKWAILSSFIALMVLMVGMIMGALIIKKFSKPIYINQQPQVQQIQQPIDYGGR